MSTNPIIELMSNFFSSIYVISFKKIPAIAGMTITKSFPLVKLCHTDIAF